MSKGGFRFNTTENPNFNDVRSGYAKGSDPEFLYYNAQIINNSTDTTSKVEDPKILFQDTRTMALLQDKSNYGVSVEKFTINGAGKNLPLFIPQIREFNSDGSKNTNPDNTIYDITFTWQYGGTKESPSAVYQSTRSIQWVPENQASWQTKPLPLGQYSYPQPEIPYYYCYSYSHWIKLVNSALACAWQDVKLSATTGGVAGTTIIINSLSGSKVTLDNVSGTFVVGALINQVETDVTSVAIIDQVSPVFVISVLEGTFNAGDSFIQDPDFPQQKPDVSLASATIVTLVPSTFTIGGTVQDLETGALGKVISFQGNTLVLYETTGDFNPGDTIFEDVPVMDTGSAKITSVSTSSIVVPPIEFGTKCPFFTYDSKTNLFSLYQDANTCVTPYGSSVSSGTFGPSNPPNPLNVFGASTASGYQAGEYSFIGYNTNFESLLTNFDTTYYSDQIAYPSQGFLGVEIQSPIGNELCEDLTTVDVESATIDSFTTDQMTVTWTSTLDVPGSNWSFATPSLVSSASKTLVVSSTYTFTLDSPTTVSYIKVGTSLKVTASNGKFAVGIVTAKTSSSIDLQITSISASPCIGSEWTLTLTPNTSTTTATPSAGIPVSLSSSLYPTQSPLEAGFLVNVTGPEGQSFSGSISSYEETLGYTGASGVTGSYISYDNSTLANGFNPIVSYQAQVGNFDVRDTVQGQTSKATGQIIEMINGNSGVLNTITIQSQSGPFVIGDNVQSGSATATITNISGLNNSETINRTGLLTVGETYVNSVDSKTYYSGPFAVGDTIINIANPSNSAVISAIEGDNGYTTLSYSSQKNPFVIGHTIDCYISLNDTSSSVCSGKIVDIIGDNLGYGTVNISNQNGQFGIGEQIVNNYDNSVATIVSIEGTNNGYGTISYINQTTTGAPGSFVSDEFLLFANDQTAFAKVIIDNQNVINQTEGNIGNVTVITGVEIGGVFTPTSNIPLPVIGEQIQGSQSGTLADYGGIVYLESCTLTVNNIVGKFNVGDTVVDNVGFGIANSSTTISVTATCNGFSYLGNGKLILKNSEGGVTEPSQFPTNSFIVDIESASPPTQTNTIAVNVIDITQNRQFINGDPIIGLTSGAVGTVIANCGSFPYPSTDATNQLLTILPNKGSAAFLEGEQLRDTRPAVTLNNVAVSDISGPYNIGDLVTVYNYVALTNAVEQTGNKVALTLASSKTIAEGTEIKGNTSGAIGTVLSGSGTSYILENVDGTFGTTETISWASASGYVYIPTPNPLAPTNLILTNVTGTFPNTTTTIQNNVLQTSCRISSGSLDADSSTNLINFGYVINNVVVGKSFYSWKNNEIIYIRSLKYLSSNIFASSLSPLKYLEYDALSIEAPIIGYTSSDGMINPRVCRLVVSKQSQGTNWTAGQYVRGWNGGSLDGGDASQVGGRVLEVKPLSSGKYELLIIIGYYQDVANTGGSPGLSIATTLNCTTDPVGGTPWNNDMARITSIIAYSHWESGIDHGTDYAAFYVTLGNNNSSYLKTTYATSSEGVDTEGTILNLNISSSNAFVQNSKPPQDTTALTLTNVDGTFIPSNIIRDTTTLNFGSVQDYTDTTTQQPSSTTLLVEDVVGTFTSGDTITDLGNSRTATVKGTSFANGEFIMKPLLGTFTPNEPIIDLANFSKATYITKTNQIIQGPTGEATVLVDNGSQLSITGATGSFAIGNTIQSELGVQADIVGFPLFGVGNIVTQLGPIGATGTIVSDNGSQLVVKSVVGPFVTGSTISSVGATGTVSSVSNPVLNIVPLNSTGESSSWTIVPTPLTSSSIVEPGPNGTFTTNLTFEQTIYNVGDTLEVIEANPVFTVEQLYLPENVVQVDLSSGNASKQTLESVFPSTETGSVYAVLVQDYESTSSLWSPVASIVIGTQFITVREEYSGTPITIGNGNLGSNTTASSFQKVLLETPLELLPQTEWRGLLNYTPQVETLSSLGLSKEELKNLDFQIYWRNRLTNSLTPLTLYNGGSANIRLLFKRIHE